MDTPRERGQRQFGTASMEVRGRGKLKGHSEIMHVQDLLTRGCADDTRGCRGGDESTLDVIKVG
jgi:hypothetical protein